MSDDLLATVKAALDNYAATGFYQMEFHVSDALRALVTRCEQAEAAYQEAQVRIAGLEAERDHYREALTTLRQRHAEAVESAFRSGYRHWPDHGRAEDAAWLASEAKARLIDADPPQ